MVKCEALQLLKDSFSKGTTSPFPDAEDRDFIISRENADLINSVIDPFQVTLNAAAFPQYGFEEFSHKKIYAIAKNGTHYLLCDPENCEYALAWSENGISFNMLGFISDDALAEWRG